MRTATFTLVALALCARAWSQAVAKPDVDWSTIERQLETLPAAVQARDIEKSQKTAQQLWSLTTEEWTKQVPSAADRLADAESRSMAANTASLPYLAMQAVQAGQLDKAQVYANLTLQTPSSSYDSIHTGNVVLGLVALNRDGDLSAAKAYLLAAAKTKGSGILDRWGPNLALAKALLDKGQTETVLEYLQSCKSFVTKNPKLDDWIALLKGGRAPDFSREYLWFQ
jgi:hypothetical protein